MNVDNITKGIWEIDTECSGKFIELMNERTVLAHIYYEQPFDVEIKEAKANAELIAEAGNVANETGLSPRELLEQRDLLWNWCKLISERDVYDGAISFNIHEQSKLIETLNKCTNKTK